MTNNLLQVLDHSWSIISMGNDASGGDDDPSYLPQ